MKLIALIFLLSLSAFFAEVAVLPITQCSAMHQQKMDKCGVCKTKHKKDTCKSSNKKNSDGCGRNAFCFNCPLCSVFLAYNLSTTITTQNFNKTNYLHFADNIISAYVSDAWKPPDMLLLLNDKKSNSLI